MIDAYGAAIAILLEPMSLLVMIVGIIAGLIVGVIPGIGGLVLIALLLPFIFRAPAEIALILLIAISSVGVTGGSITAILLGVPGTGPNAATVLDGFPMMEKGEGARAIGAAVTSSMAGGVMPVFLALAMIPLLMPIIMAFGQPEMAMLVLVGISFLAVLTGHSPIRGFIAGMLGILIGLIGSHAVTAVDRFTFGTRFLYDGLGIMPVAVGLFGLSALLSAITKGQATIAQKAVAAKLAGVFEGAKDVWRHKWLWLRSTLIGYVIGVIPGIGGDAAMFICYGQAKQTSKHPEEFGTGCVEGVIGPESANNAKEAGALLTTMAFGIPGSAVMVLFLGAFTMVGVQPGPKMMVEYLPLALTLLLGIALANVIGGVFCLFSAPYLARVASVHLDFLFPAVVIVALAGAFTATASMANIIVAIVFGMLGFLMQRYDYSRPALLLGFVLGNLLENYSLLSIKIYGPLFFITPISLTLIAILILLLCYPSLRKILPKFQLRFKKSWE